ncbi:MAG: hypothetical protein ACP5O0_02325 [Acidimicrobiales bacterium]
MELELASVELSRTVTVPGCVVTTLPGDWLSMVFDVVTSRDERQIV